MELKPFNIRFTTKSHINELICPASITVCFITCLLQWSRLQKGNYSNTFSKNELDKIVIYAATCELIWPDCSMIDVEVCTFSNIIKYSADIINASITLHEIPRMTILLVSSQSDAPNLETYTQRLVHLMKTCPRDGKAPLSSINAKTEAAYKAFKKLVDIYKNQYNVLDTETRRNNILEQHNILKASVRANQLLLKVSRMTPEFLINTLAQKYGTYAKYTDSGYGRYAYILCPRLEDEPKTYIKNLMKDLESKELNVIKTSFARSGVKIKHNLIAELPESNVND